MTLIDQCDQCGKSVALTLIDAGYRDKDGKEVGCWLCYECYWRTHDAAMDHVADYH